MHKQNRSDREVGLENIMESMYKAAALEPLCEKHDTAKCDHCGGTGNHGDQDCKKCGGDGWIDAKDVVKEDDEVCPKCGKVHINAGCGVKHEAAPGYHGPHKRSRIDVTKEVLFSTVTGDPSTWQVGQIIPSQISRDDYDGIILNVGEENGEQTFDVAQYGGEGWTINTSNLNLPDDDTGRIPPSSKWQDDPTRNPNAPSPTG
jgi:hypothetical protein